MPRSLLKRAQTGWLVPATDYRKLNEPPRPRLQRNGTIYLMAWPPLLCQGGDFAFPAGCPRRPCPADDLWVTLKHARRGGRAIQKISRSIRLSRGRGGFPMNPKGKPPRLRLLRWLRQIFFDDAATLLAVVQRWCKEGNNALSQLIHSFGDRHQNSSKNPG